MLTASLVLVAALVSASSVAAKSTKEISPYPLGERSVFSERAIAERVKPVGSVCVEGEECGSAAAAGEEVASGPRSGEAVYNASCAACHATGAAGAPKTGDTAAWAPRIAQGDATLLDHAINGLNAMPPKGMCMECSDDEIKAAVEYMVEKSQ
ncbi:MAG: cytochrome c5 family protein [Pseudomonadales bacterium]|nr:cytochrome c5 family protein [Pseudomonadales bacterium]